MIKARLEALMFGTVVDNNVTNVSSDEVKRLVDELRQEGLFRDYEMRKEAVDKIEVKRAESGEVVVALEVRGKSFSYNFGNACLEQTVGGLGYNVFQNLVVLNNSIYRYMEVYPTLIIPSEKVSSIKRTFSPQVWKEGICCGVPRQSLMIVVEGETPVNLVSKKAEARELPIECRVVPDIEILTTYPETETDRQIKQAIETKERNHNLRIYFNPGGTQVNMGYERFVDVLSRVDLAVMKVDEAIRFLRMPEQRTRDEAIEDCFKHLHQLGVKRVILNDAERGSYLSYQRRAYHVLPFSKEKAVALSREVFNKATGEERTRYTWPAFLVTNIETIPENFSGCGDSIFSTMLYLDNISEGAHFNPRYEMKNLEYASRIARIVSLLPTSNLENVSSSLVGRVLRGD